MNIYKITYKDRGIECEYEIPARSMICAISDFYHIKGVVEITKIELIK